MQKNEVIAAVVMENIYEPHKAENVQRVSRDGLKFLRFRTVLQSLDVLNRNRRIYSTPAITKAVMADHIQELIRAKSLIGEAAHPITNDTARVMTIDQKFGSHFITSLEVIGNLVYGDIETMAGTQFGDQLMFNIMQGMEPAFSLRAMASLTKRNDGTSLANGRIHMVTYDQVILPSHREAYRDKNTKILTVNKGFESECVTESGIVIPLTESAIKDFIAMESSNVKLVSNFCEVAMESMELSTDLKTVILRENGSTFHVKLEDKVKHEVRNFMMNL